MTINSENQYYSLTSTAIRTVDLEYVKINRKISADELKITCPNLKGVILSGRVSCVNSDNLEEYIESLFACFELEELTLEEYNLERPFMYSEWPSSLLELRFLRFNTPDSQVIKSLNKCNLLVLSISRSSVVPSIELLSLNTLNSFYTDLPFEDLSALSNAINLNFLYVSIKDFNLNIDFRGLINLEHLFINSETKLYYQFDLSNCTKLQTLNLYNFDLLPKGIQFLSNLKNITLGNIGNSNSLQQLHFDSLPVLAHISITECNLELSKERFLGELPALTNMNLSNTSQEYFELNEACFISPTLSNVSVEGFIIPKVNRPEPIPSLTINNVNKRQTGEGLEVFKNLSLYDVQLPDIGFLHLQKLSNLEYLSISSNGYGGKAVLKVLPELGRENLNLMSLSLSVLGVEQLPKGIEDCPNLTQLTIGNSPNLKILSTDVLDNVEKLNLFEVSAIPKEIVNWSNLKSLKVGRDLIPKENTIYESLIPVLAGDISLDKELKELICGLILGHVETLKEDPLFKENLLRLFGLKKIKVTQLALLNLHLLNKDGVSLDDDLKNNNTIGFLNSSSTVLKNYKDKLDSFNLKVSPKIAPDTFFIVANGYSKLPDNFWSFEHRFIEESVVSEWVKDINPGFIQTLEDLELENLKKLVYSNNEENDKLLAEMIKTGGFPDSIIPELIIIAKTSKNLSAKSSIRKLLESRLSIGAKKILSDKINLAKPSYMSPFEVYREYDPGISISQMAYAYFKRNGEYLNAFFNTPDSLNNPNRESIFQENWKRFVPKPHYISLYYIQLTGRELKFILEQEEVRGIVNRLVTAKVSTSELFNFLAADNPQIAELQIVTDDRVLSSTIADLKKLKSLKITAQEDIILPGEILQLSKLKEVTIWAASGKKVFFQQSDIEKYGKPKFKSVFSYDIINE